MQSQRAISRISKQRPRLVFHVGSHKTGTTALQDYFSAQRLILERHGVLYPEAASFLGELTSARNHACVIQAAAQNTETLRKRLDLFAADLADKAKNGKTVFLSSETAYRLAADGVTWEKAKSYWDARRRLLERLVYHFSAFDLQFILCLRRPDRLAESHFAESAAATEAMWSFDDFIRTKSYRYAYDRQISLFRSVAPTRVLQYESARQTGLITTFCTALGIPAIGEPEQLVRPSLSVRAQCWMQMAKRERDLLPRERNRRWLFGLEHGKEFPFEGEDATHWACEFQRRNFVDRALSHLVELTFPPLTDHLPPKCSWDQSDQIRADHAFSEWQLRNADRIAAREHAGLRPFEQAQPQ